MSSSARPCARLEAIEIVIAELLANQMAALPPESAAALAGRLQARAGYVSADPGYDPADRHAHDVASAMERLLQAASFKAAEAARTAAFKLRPLRSDMPVRRATGGAEPVGAFD
jgi:hypothetical protein